jgi:hypothetical protein
MEDSSLSLVENGGVRVAIEGCVSLAPLYLQLTVPRSRTDVNGLGLHAFGLVLC